jgi:hypothetical protein
VPATTLRKSKPAPAVKGGTRFKFNYAVLEKDTAPPVSSVDVEYEKYTSGILTAHGMDILQFWEVRFQ